MRELSNIELRAVTGGKMGDNGGNDGPNGSGNSPVGGGGGGGSGVGSRGGGGTSGGGSGFGVVDLGAPVRSGGVYFGTAVNPAMNAIGNSYNAMGRGDIGFGSGSSTTSTAMGSAGGGFSIGARKN